ncbi:nicotinamide-nucleotide amidase [Neptuniibacter sp. PT34_22]|uniref:nicotinamide-nucleotide amidase n=1 Tax=Neptuniibacter sp. PT34_22 TaxID=3398205 RepID=UPI0039F4661E
MQLPLTDIAEKLQANNLFIATAESCTGGWVAQEITAIPGSSAWFDCGFVTYSNMSKQKMLGVSKDTLEQYGAVSAEVVTQMAMGALENSDAHISVATSGIAGPAGGSKEKPVGTVWFAWAEQGKSVRTKKYCFEGDRESVRKQAVSVALEGILQNLSD